MRIRHWSKTNNTLKTTLVNKPFFCATTCASIFSDSQLDDRIYNYLPWDSAESTVTWTSDKQSGQPVQTLSSHSPDPCPVRSKHHQNT